MNGLTNMSNSKHYQVLGLPPNASPRRIKEQYRKLAKTYHPDRLTDPVEKARLEEKFKEINEAYTALAEIVKRANLSPKERKLDFLYQQAIELFGQNKFSKAMVVFNEILAIDSTYQNALTLLQECRRKHKRLAALYARADALYRQQKWPEAAAGFEAVLKDDPHYKDAAKKLKRARREQLMTDFMSQY